MAKSPFDQIDALSANDYLIAFRKSNFSEQEKRLLLTHLSCAKHVATARHLAMQMGYRQGRAINLRYGTLAKRVAKALGIQVQDWLFVLADFKAPVKGDSLLILRSPVVSALQQMFEINGRQIISPKTISQLKPTSKSLVMNLVQEAGFDVSEWKKMKGGASKAASNPKFCYNWSFEQPGEAVALCLWHKGLKKDGNKIVFRLRPKRPRSSRRAVDMERHIAVAYSQQLPLRVLVVDGDVAGAKVRFRLLDPIAWAVAEYNAEIGSALLVRGNAPAVPAIAPPDFEMSFFEGVQKQRYIHHRSREAAARREKLREAMRQNGGRLICEVPKCGFDFQRRYGVIGLGYAQVHHLQPLGKSPKQGRKVLLKHLAVVCANCHAMIHAGGKCRPLKGLIQYGRVNAVM